MNIAKEGLCLLAGRTSLRDPPELLFETRMLAERLARDGIPDLVVGIHLSQHVARGQANREVLY